MNTVLAAAAAVAPCICGHDDRIDLAGLAGIWHLRLNAELNVVAIVAPADADEPPLFGNDALGQDVFTVLGADPQSIAGLALTRLFRARQRVTRLTLSRGALTDAQNVFVLSGAPRWAADGSFAGYDCAISNVDLPGASRSAHYYEAILSAFVHNVPNLVVVKDIEGRFLTVNPLAERNYNEPQGSLIGRRAQDVLPAAVAAECNREDDEVLDSEQTRIVEQSFAWPDGVHTFHTIKFPIFDAEQCLLGTGAVGIDITEQKRIEAGLHRRANFDVVTGLPNRQLTVDRLNQAVAAGRRSKAMVGLVFVDVGDFKSINAALGRAAADRLLTDVAGQLRSVCRETDTVARMDGDVFCLLLTQLKKPDELKLVAQKALAAVQQLSAGGDNAGLLQPSAGTALYPDDASNADDLIERARLALERAKRYGRGVISAYTTDFSGDDARRAQIEKHLCGALAAGEFKLAYQPIVNAADGQITGAEALLRWTNAELGVVRPDEFIPVAEATGLIRSIGAWVFRQACLDTVRINTASERPIRVAVNVSVRQLADPQFLGMVAAALSEAGVSPQLLKVEMTESAFAGEAGVFKETIETLQTMGIRVSLDDFGTGYSSLAYLHQYRFSQLKIDRSFISDLTAKQEGYLLVDGIIRIAHNLRLTVVAEGVETPEQMKLLSEMGCDRIQGYLISKPVPLVDFQALMAA